MQTSRLVLTVSGSLEPDTSEGDSSIAHLMLDLGSKAESGMTNSDEGKQDPLLLEVAPEVIQTLLDSALTDGHLAIVRFSRAAQAVGMSSGRYVEAAQLRAGVAELRRLLLREKSHVFLPFTAWLVPKDAEDHACRVLAALTAIPDDEGLFDEALALCTAAIEVFPSFADLFIGAERAPQAMEWLRTALLQCPLEVLWRVQP